MMTWFEKLTDTMKNDYDYQVEYWRSQLRSKWCLRSPFFLIIALALALAAGRIVDAKNKA